MLDVLLTASVSFIITFLAIPVVLQIANQKKLYDIPDERKVHTHAVASLGGVGIFGGVSFGFPALYSRIPESRVPIFFCGSPCYLFSWFER